MQYHHRMSLLLYTDGPQQGQAQAQAWVLASGQLLQQEKCVIPPWESHSADAGVSPVLGLAGFHSARSTMDPLPSGILRVIMLSSMRFENFNLRGS